MKTRVGDPWIPAADYGRLLPQLTVNLIVRDIEQSVSFYADVLSAHVHYADADFAAIKIGTAEVMLHADHTYDANPWWPRLTAGEPRGLGAELRILGLDLDEVRAKADGRAAIFKEVSERGHGWRELMIEDPDGYVWVIGALLDRP